MQAKKGGRGKAAGGKRPGGAGGKGKAAATPVAVPNGSVGLTPGSALLAPKSTGGRLAATLGGASTAARPPRPAKTPGSAATGGSLARLLAQGTPAGAAGASADCVAVESPACSEADAVGWSPQPLLAGVQTSLHFHPADSKAPALRCMHSSLALSRTDCPPHKPSLHNCR